MCGETRQRIVCPGLSLPAVLCVLLCWPIVGPAATSSAQDAAPPQRAIVPDSAIQSSLESIARADSAASREAAILRLIDQHRGRGEVLVPQLLSFAARQSADSGSRSVVGRVLRRLELPKPVLVKALAPHLDNADSQVRRIAGSLLSETEDRSADRPPDFSGYRAVIEADVRAGRPPQESLILFMYASDPGAALRTLVRACQLRDPAEIKPILWAEHVVADLLWKRQHGFIPPTGVEPAAKQQLESLSRHGRWWVRLYLAEVLRNHAELGSPELLRRLSADPNPLVRLRIRPDVPADGAPNAKP